jgi:hypothetical protein
VSAIATLARAALVYVSDRRWFGLQALEQHVVICGFPRSGSTLLQGWLESALPDATTFGRERSGLLVARRHWPGRHPLLLTKRPGDIDHLESIRRVYEGRRTRVSFIITTRDPRAVLTSKHSASSDYYVSVDRWRAVAKAVERHAQDADVLVVDYAEIVLAPARTEERIATFLGRTLTKRLASAHEALPSGFDGRALNGVRPLDPTRLDTWQAPQHAERLRVVSQACPEIEAYLKHRAHSRDTRDLAR